MNFSNATLTKVIKNILIETKKQKNKTKEEIEFIKQYNNFGNDVGLISILLFNYLELKPNEAIFIGAGIPHAYLKGNIIECMANSDNVIRAGLTKKYKDVETLLSILKFQYSDNRIIKPRANSVQYTYFIKVNEFSVSLSNYIKPKLLTVKNNSELKIILVMLGVIIIEWKEESVILERKFKQGEAFLIPANLSYYKIKNNNSTKFITVEIPKKINEK